MRYISMIRACNRRVRALVVVLALVAISLAVPVHAQDIQPLPDYSAQADLYLDDIRGRYDEAPDVMAGRLNSQEGDAHAEGEQWYKAVIAYERAVARGIDNVRTWLGLSEALLHWGRFDDAISAGYRAWTVALRQGDRARALFAMGAALERTNHAREALKLYQAGLNEDYNEEFAARMQILADATAFRLTNASTNVDGEQAQICLEFRNPLKDGKAVRYADYIRLSPESDATYTVADNQLCIGSLTFGTRYSVSVLEGLPSIYDEQLQETDDVVLEIGDRAPSVGFSGSTFVLPSVGSQGIPLFSVNVERVKLHLLRVTDRNLVQQIQYGRLSRAIDAYERSQIADDIGEQLWTGEMDIDGERNRRVATSIPIFDLLPATAPGIYVMTAETPDDAAASWKYRATQWFVITDLGLTTMTGPDGLHVFARSLATGRPVESVDVRLYARNNDELGKVTTDATGRASFAPGLSRGGGSRAATAVMAMAGNGDFVFLDVTQSAFDLSDRGVGGRPAPGAIDAFLYTDRGVYRPGETVHAVALLRDVAARMRDDAPLTLRIHRPDGALAEEQTLTESQAGGFHVAWPISPAARTGGWTIYAYVDPAGEIVGSANFLVEDVVPARIEVGLAPSVARVVPSSPLSIVVEVKYLYGAPATGLPVKGSLTISRESQPFEAFSDYVFTLADDDVKAVQLPFDDMSTDEAGKAAIESIIDQIPDTPQPLKATINVEVYEFGGRPVIESVELPIASRDRLVGLRPLFSDDRVADGAEAAFEAIAVAADGTQVALDGARYTIFREEWDYQWYFRNGYWDYEYIIRDVQLTSGALALSAGQPARIAETVDWGRYRVEIYDPVGGSAASYRFSAGWGAAPGASGTPDKLRIVADKETYRAGDIAVLRLEPPFAGAVQVIVATDRILEVRELEASADGLEISMPIDEAWGAGAYVMATAFRPASVDSEHGPGRAIGVAWLALDPAAHRLQVEFDAPAETTPRQSIQIPITVTGADDAGAVYLTLAAVDEGVLQLTEFESPDPLEYFFGKRRLAFDIRDVYGNLIQGKEGRRGIIRAGGDGAALSRRSAPPRAIELVALFSGIVRLDAEGRARVPLDLPDFNGRLRMMVVAYDKYRVGAAESALVVRDPVVVLSSMPRFLAVGDNSELLLNLQNVDGPTGPYQISLEANGVVMLSAAPLSETQQLEAGATARVVVPLRAVETGLGEIVLTIAGPEGFRLARTLRIGVRPAQLDVVERVARRLDPGQSLTLGEDALARFVPGSGELYASVAATPNLDVPGLLRTLDRYPYGCLEQTTSRALPLLYVGDVAALWRVAGDAPQSDRWLKSRVQDAVHSVVNRQRYDGGFGLWWSDSPAELWLSSYAIEFLLRARDQGYAVPTFALTQGLRWVDELSRTSRDDDVETLAARAYGQYVAALARQGDLSATRYLADTYLKRMPNALAAAHLGAALALHGDQPRATVAFRFALAKVDRERLAIRDYGTPLRDFAATVALMLETGTMIQEAGPLVERIAALQMSSMYLSTQEQAWLILLAKSIAESSSAEMTLSLDDAVQPARRERLDLRPSAAQLDHGLTIGNAGDAAVWTTTTLMGAPLQDLAPVSDGLALTRRYYTLDGKAVEPTTVRQSDMLVVLLEGRGVDQVRHQLLVVDLLPAGFELENARLADARSTSQLSWLPELTPTVYTEFLDDRFVAAVDTDWHNRGFKLAYLVRAVTPGSYRHPAAYVEDMYLPEVRARTALGTVTVTPYQ